MKKPKKSQLLTIILTGLSGAGKTVALHAFEDSGFFCVDNLPSTLIDTFASLGNTTPTISKVAIGVDIRDRNFIKDFSETISSLRKNHKIEIIFIEASDDVLIRRFKESRRPHPLGYKDLTRALHKEAKLLQSIRQEADEIIDTSSLNPHELRKLITTAYLKKGPKDMVINLMSFGFKYGIPLEADLLFDVRFLPNPYFIEELKEFSGTTPKVKKFVLSHKNTKDFLNKLKPLLEYSIPLYRKEGRSYLTIGIGCTGGKHRSPAIVEELKQFVSKEKQKVTVTHRDLSEQ